MFLVILYFNDVWDMEKLIRVICDKKTEAKNRQKQILNFGGCLKIKSLTIS